MDEDQHEFPDRRETPRPVRLPGEPPLPREPHERHHHELGRRTLLRLATTPEAQAAAQRAARRTLELADELQKKALATAGIHHAPGC